MKEKKDSIFIIEKGNKVFYAVMILFICITVVGCIKIRHCMYPQVKTYLLLLNIISLGLMIPYRIALVFDKEYMNLVYPNVKKAGLFELPFFPCNTAEILFLFAVILESKMLLAYCFFLCCIGPIAAFCSPPLGFEKGSIFNYKMIGFYGTHYLCMMNIPFMLVSGFYIPGYMDVAKAMAFYAVLSFVMYLFNIWVNTLDLGYTCNYFFTYDPSYHPVFTKMYDFIPHKYIYTLPVVVLCGIILSIFVFMIHIFI